MGKLLIFQNACYIIVGVRVSTQRLRVLKTIKGEIK
jgi:hypothetical protein